METAIEQLLTFATNYGLKILGAVLILVVGRVTAGLARRIVKRILERAETDPTIVSFVGSMVYVLILVLVVLAALAQFGVQTASFIAILGAASFAVGFALQGSLANFAAGVAGTVKEIRLFTTVLATPDNIQIMVPDGKIYGELFRNITAYDTRRVDLVVGISYTSSIKRSVEVLSELMRQDTRVLSEPAPQIAVSELADSSVNLVVRPWVRKEDYWSVKFDLTRKIKETFDENGIEIPFPQRVVHLVQAESES